MELLKYRRLEDDIKSIKYPKIHFLNKHHIIAHIFHNIGLSTILAVLMCGYEATKNPFTWSK